MNRNQSLSHAGQIKVWDIFVRAFHWTLVVAFFTAYLTEDDVMWLHTAAGYTIVGLLIARFVWGFVGPRHARFSDFVRSPAAVLQYLRGVLTGSAPRYVGHNPAGGAMIVALLISLTLATLTGLAAYATGEHPAGPLVSLLTGAPKWLAEGFEEVHEFFANFTLLLVGVHVAGVVFESLLHGENLVRTMIHGYKRA